MISPQANKYLENSVQTASPAQLLIMLCDAGIRFSKLSIECIKNGDLLAANEHIKKVQDIVSEFVITLDQSSPIADSLMRLYDYFLYQLIQANMKKDIAPIQEVMGYLAELKETWIQAARQLATQKPGAGNG